MWEGHENNCKDLDVFLMQLGYVDKGRMEWFHTGAEKMTSVGQIPGQDLALNNLW